MAIIIDLYNYQGIDGRTKVIARASMYSVAGSLTEYQ